MSSLATYIRALDGTILVTGASGFVGANLFKKILDVRRDVYAVVRQEKGWRLAEIHDERIIAVEMLRGPDHMAMRIGADGVAVIDGDS